MGDMRYISLFSGIEAATVAWEPLGWEPVCFAELDPFPCAVLEHRYPDVPNVGDVTKVNWKKFKNKCDIVVGGSPCQSFSVAGKREGLSGESGLMFEYIRAVREVRPRWFLWENVPGALSSEGGEAFRQLLSEMDKLGYGLAWRVLDAQFFGVAQRRRRVFLVGHLGDARACEVLFEPESLRGDYPSSREKREALAAAARRGASSAGFKFHQGAGAGNIGFEVEQSPTCTADWHNPGVLVYGAGRLNPEDPQSKRIFAPESCGPTLSSGAGEGMHIQPSALMANPGVCTQYGEEVAGTLTARYDSSPCPDRGQNVICMADDNAKAAIDEDMCGSLKVGGSAPWIAQGRMVVRRLTPMECGRLQGFTDDWTKVPYRGKPAEECPDGPRYKAIGNSFAVPVVRWIGERIAIADKEEE